VDGPDFLLIAWWLFAVATVVPVALIVRRSRIDHREIAISAGLRRQPNNPSQNTKLPGAALFAMLLLVAIFIVGFCFFLWASNWTRLLHIKFQIFCFCFCAASGWAALSGKVETTKEDWLPAPALRGLMLIVGVLGTPFSLYIVVGDLTFPSIVVEGRADGKEHFGTRSDTYYLVINGTRYNTTREVYLPISRGDRIHAELGAASKIIYVARKL
jgi:hypothetical protein